MPSEEKSVSKKTKFKIQSRGFVAFPAWFVDEFMHSRRRADCKGIPASFWTFLLVIFRDINHHADNTCKRTMRQFPIRPSAATKWTAALRVSGLFQVDYGTKKTEGKAGTPTKFEYLDRDYDLWDVFLSALAAQLASDKLHHTNDAGLGFRAELLLRIIDFRRARGVGNPNTSAWEKEYLNWCEKQGVLEISGDANDHHSFTVSRLHADRSGVLSAEDKVDGVYPRSGEPEFDEESGKRIRHYRQNEPKLGQVTVRKMRKEL